MTKRFWIAVGVGVAIGGGAVASFAPLVRSRVEAKAEAYGAEVRVEQVIPGLSGIKLRGVEVTVADMPGVRVWLDEVVVGWDRRPQSTSGGKIVAVGSMATLVSQFERWKAAHLQGGEGSSSGEGRKLGIEDFAVEWHDAATAPELGVSATGVDIAKEGERITIRADHLEATAASAGASVEVQGGVVALTRAGSGFRVAELATTSLALSVDLGDRPLLGEAGGEDDEEVSPPASASASSAPAPGKGAPQNGRKAVPMPGAAPAAEGGDVAVVHRRVKAARKARAWAQALAARLEQSLEADAKIAVRGAKARLTFGSEMLNLGPGTLSVRNDAGDFVVAMDPEGAPAAEGGSALTFSARVPLAADSRGGAPETRPVRLEVHGGPVWLSTLGVREGDLGLKSVDETQIEADMVVTLPPGEQTVAIDGRGKVHKLALFDARLASDPIEGVELAWRAKANANLDGSRVVIDDAEIDLGDIRAVFKGNWERHAGTAAAAGTPGSPSQYKVDLEYELPLMTCERAFASLPNAVVPSLKGMHFAGSLAMKGHAKFDTADIKRKYDLDWDGTLSCRVTEAPANIQPHRFKASFEKLVYTADGKETTMTFGPSSENWVPMASISRFMEGGVLTTEDGRFFRHIGFDKEAIINSIQQNIEARRFVRGASTISMQLAKNLYLPREKTLARKLQEAILTLYLEQELTKRELMELYLNVIEYGPMIYGIGPAARHYFNTHAGHLSLGQSMYLASILRNPKKQYFGAGGAVIDSYMRMLHSWMKILHKINRISDEELDQGLRETVVFGSPSPMIAPKDDDDVYPVDDPPGGATQNTVDGSL